MSNKTLAMQIVRQLMLLIEQGFSQRAISRELKISRTTVKQYIARLNNYGQKLPILLNLDDASLAQIIYPERKKDVPDARKEDFSLRTDYLIPELKRTGVTRQLLWEEYKKEYPDGYGYSKFCGLLEQEHKIKNASMHFSYVPGQMMMIDFAGDMISYIDRESGELISCPVLVCVLPYSGYSYVVALANATIPQLIKGLNQCLDFFTGVPLSIKCDNMKQMVTKSCRYEPVFTEAIQQWAMHYQISLLAARVRKPKDKALVENEVKLSYQRIYAPLRDLEFFSIEELNAAILKQLAIHHKRPYQRKDYCRLDCFTSEEQPVLKVLPEEHYQLSHSVKAKVQKNYHITLGEDWHHYSVPFSYIGKTVQAVYDADNVEIYCLHQRITLHKRNYRKHGYTTVKEHMPEGHQRYFEQKGWDATYFLGEAKKIGDCTHQYIGLVLQGKHFTEQTYNACLGLLRLGKTHTATRLEAACKRALTGRAYTYKTIDNILKNNLDAEPGSAPADLFSLPSHDNIRGAEAYQ